MTSEPSTEYIHLMANSMARRQLITLASISICNIFSAEMATFAKESNCGSFLRKSKLVIKITPFRFIFYLTSNETPLPLPPSNFPIYLFLFLGLFNHPSSSYIPFRLLRHIDYHSLIIIFFKYMQIRSLFKYIYPIKIFKHITVCQKTFHLF